MKNSLAQVFKSGKFLVGFSIIVAIVLAIIVYPLLVPGNPLEMIGVGTFFKPGTYISAYDAVNSRSFYTLNLTDAAAKRVASKLSDADREVMLEWFTLFFEENPGDVDLEEMDINDTQTLVTLWWETYDPSIRFDSMTSAKRKYIARVDAQLEGILEDADVIIAAENDDGTLSQSSVILGTDYVNVSDIASVRILPLGTDNFGRDVLKQMISACRTSLLIGLIAGTIATLIGLVLGLLSGYVGGIVDDVIMFVTNLFTVIPSFVLLILISFSIGQEQRGARVVAVVIGVTSWVWTTRSVRAQVVSLRNRDHVNLSKLSGHSLVRILIMDILPYIASYVIMAFILQVCSGILAEAQLSMLGLGPKTTQVPTLGLMMYWAMAYAAHINGAWWAYFPIVILIAIISFSLNLMNTGLDQVFNPQLRD
ncbi:MAG: ABC transporter permease [Clostridiales bacterium]|nr:ABC transporter permease [Clostridiales bacterium]